MAHNPSYVGKTHVVTYKSGKGDGYWDDAHEVIGVHGDYGSARSTVDKHMGAKAKRMTNDYAENLGVLYHHPDQTEEDRSDAQPYYHIHREDAPGKFTKV